MNTAQDFIDRSRLCIAQGALTNSKRAATFVEGVYPQHVVGGDGCKLVDVSNKWYIDYICGLGTNLLGYGAPPVKKAISNFLNSAVPGSSLSLSSVEEVWAAEKVKELIPFVERVKFVKTGTEACNAAIRIARAYTGKEVILSEGYHGWGDDFISMLEPAAGIPLNIKTNITKLDKELTALDEWKGNCAAVIVEPVSLDMSQERRTWLEKLREKCTKLGIVLIFDEIITGFRVPRYTISSYWGIRPDLICIGKAMANGFPLAAVCGKKELMDNPKYFVSGTYAGEVLSLRVCLEVLTALQRNEYSLDALWERGAKWLKEFNAVWPEGVRIVGYASRGAFQGDEIARALFMQEACLAGFLFGPSWFYNFPLSDLGSDHLGTIKEIICKVKQGKVQLKGKMPVPPLAQMMRQNK